MLYACFPGERGQTSVSGPEFARMPFTASQVAVCRRCGLLRRTRPTTKDRSGGGGARLSHPDTARRVCKFGEGHLKSPPGQMAVHCLAASRWSRLAESRRSSSDTGSWPARCCLQASDRLRSASRSSGVRMFQRGEDPPLLAEPLEYEGRSEAAAHNLDRDPLVKLAAGPLCQVGRAHAARAAHPRPGKARCPHQSPERPCCRPRRRCPAFRNVSPP